jgi:AsmA protein
MRKWIIVAGAIVVITVLVGFLLLLNINSLIARNKGYLIAQAEDALGRKVSMGEVQATLWSGLGARIADFTMSDDPAYSSGEFVRAKDLQINLRFWPLLRKEVQVKRVTLHDPVIQIVRNADGKFNFSTIGKGAKERNSGKAEKRSPGQRTGPAGMVGFPGRSFRR